ncbi:MAG: hypothetical protein AB2L24_17410 [Mangrovibacterium sp.]
MKRKFYDYWLYLTTALLPVCIFCCSGSSGDDLDDPPSGGIQNPPIIMCITELNTRASVIDSHKDEKNNLLELDFRRKVELGSELACDYPIYPRVKRLANGQYILFYQDGQHGPNIYYALSKDLLTWGVSKPLFTKYPHGSDTRCFATADAVVLQNGEILVSCCFRDLYGYSTRPWDSGLMLRRSSDNGATWTTEEKIYEGSCWEPYLLQLPSGEIHVYFTDNDPTDGIHNSGSSILRSFDNGRTWTPPVGERPIRVVHQYTYTNQDGVKIFTGQMISARLLHDNKTIAIVCESRLNYAGSEFRISYCNSTDNWATPIAEDAEGPINHQWNKFVGAGPYLTLFPSGESVLSYNAKINTVSSYLILLMGGVTADDFDHDVMNLPFPNAPTIWAATELDDPHTLIAVCSNIAGTSVGSASKATLLLGKMILNHLINAPYMTPTVDGDNKDWAGNADAFFLGSDSQAQASFRLARDDNKTYLLIDRLDDYLTSDDGFTILLNNGEKTLKFLLNYDVVNKTLVVDNSSITCKVGINGEFNDGKKDSGLVAEIVIPASLLEIKNGRLLFNAVLHDKNVNDGFNGLTENTPSKWLPVLFD